MLKLNKKVGEPKWYKYGKDGVQFSIRPYSVAADRISSDLEELDEDKDREKIIKSLAKDLVFNQFNYCLEGWKGIEDKCNEENKRYVFNIHHDAREFIFEKARDAATSIFEELKN